MESHSSNQLAITNTEFSDKVLQGGNLAIQHLIERKRKEDGFIVISQNGKVVKLRARDIPLSDETGETKNTP